MIAMVVEVDQPKDFAIRSLLMLIVLVPPDNDDYLAVLMMLPHQEELTGQQ